MNIGADIFHDPEYLPFRLDLAGSRVLFVRLDARQRREAAFLDPRALPPQPQGAWLPLSMLALVVLGASDMISVVVRSTLVQLDTPDDMRGRVGAVNSVFIGASNQLGEFESGVTAAWFGPVGAVMIGGIGTLLVVLAWIRLFPSLAGRDRLIETPRP